MNITYSVYQSENNSSGTHHRWRQPTLLQNRSTTKERKLSLLHYSPGLNPGLWGKGVCSAFHNANCLTSICNRHFITFSDETDSTFFVKRYTQICKWLALRAFDSDLVVPGKEMFGNRCARPNFCTSFYHVICSLGFVSCSTCCCSTCWWVEGASEGQTLQGI
jgi:hypothetical protein